jgi:uncharacterized protein (TIGR03067 family)
MSAARDGDKTDDLAAFQGRWRLAGVRDDGKDVDVPGGNGLKIVFKGDRILINGEPKFKVTVDATCNPKVIDLAVVEDGRERVVEGIYRFQGTTLTICLHDPEGIRMRPLTFREAGAKVFILEKVQDD